MVDTKDDTRIENARVQYNNDPRNGFPSQDNIAFTEAIKDNLPTALSEAQKDTSVIDSVKSFVTWVDNRFKDGEIEREERENLVSKVVDLFIDDEGNAITTPSIEQVIDRLWSHFQDGGKLLGHTKKYFRECCIQELKPLLSHLSHTTGGELKPMICIDKEKDGAAALYASEKDGVITIEKIDNFVRVPTEHGVAVDKILAEIESLQRKNNLYKELQPVIEIVKKYGTGGVDRESIKNEIIDEYTKAIVKQTYGVFDNQFIAGVAMCQKALEQLKSKGKATTDLSDTK